MTPIVPTLESRTYRELVAEALARIRVHNPEWTNFNDADPGVTLLQLFAFMTESLSYRCNQIPDRNRRKFLQLLGVPLRPASAAEGVITFSNERGPLDVLTLPGSVPLVAGTVGFVTTNALDVLPVEAKVFYRRRVTSLDAVAAREMYDQLYSAQSDDGATLEFYETAPFDPPASTGNLPSVSLKDDTVDDSLWIALLARPGEQAQRERIGQMLGGKTLTIGLMPWLDAHSRVLPPRGGATPDAPPALSFTLATGQLLPGELPRYQALEPTLDSDNPFENLTLVQLPLPAASLIGTWDDLEPLGEGVGDFPPTLDDDALRQRVVTWLRIQLPQTAGGTGSSAWQARFCWTGINAARVRQRVQVTAESLGTGTGQPDQVVTLVNRPVIPESVRLTVNGEPWAFIDDLQAAPPEVDVRDPALPPGSRPPVAGRSERYTVDRASGQVTFGDGLRGRRPPDGAPIFASYAYGGGAAGNVGIGQIKVAPLLPAGFKVGNPLPTWGGTEGETPDEGDRRIPRYLQHRDRAVSAADFRDIVLQTPGVSIARVEVLPLFHPGIGTPAPGVVTLLLIPNDPNNREAPMPDRLFLQAVCEYLESRRILTTEVQLSGPSYQSLSVSVGIDVVAGLDIAPVREAAKRAVRDFLSPVQGGFEGAGWPLNTPVDDRELWARVARVDGVARVRDLRMFDERGARVSGVPIAGLQLPRLGRVTVAVGDAEELVPEPPAQVKRRRPVPVVPVVC